MQGCHGYEISDTDIVKVILTDELRFNDGIKDMDSLYYVGLTEKHQNIA